jgi:hypothetical protein
MKKIKKPWAAFGFPTKDSYGFIIEDLGDTVMIIYREDQDFPPESWDIKEIKRFETAQELWRHLKLDTNGPQNNLLECMKEEFPSQFKK